MTENQDNFDLFAHVSGADLPTKIVPVYTNWKAIAKFQELNLLLTNEVDKEKVVETEAQLEELRKEIKSSELKIKLRGIRPSEQSKRQEVYTKELDAMRRQIEDLQFKASRVGDEDEVAAEKIVSDIRELEDELKEKSITYGVRWLADHIEYVESPDGKRSYQLSDPVKLMEFFKDTGGVNLESRLSQTASELTIKVMQFDAQAVNPDF